MAGELFKAGDRRVEQIDGVSTLEVSDWDDLVEQFEALQGWVFRGQMSAPSVDAQIRPLIDTCKPATTADS